MPRAIVRRLEISASARYIAIFSPSKSSYEKLLKLPFRFFNFFCMFEKQTNLRCDYYREEVVRKELELLRRHNGSRYSKLRMDALKTSLPGSSLWDTVDEKLGLSKAMETFESAINSHLKYHGEATGEVVQKEKSEIIFNLS